jgi:lipopolysaccharide/colanic/teichoic acid biosynthesis glycosyltransferase
MFRELKGMMAAIRSVGASSVDGIHSEEVFRAFVDHERAVAERNGLAMCVVAFHLEDDRTRWSNANRLSVICAARLRATDVTGWLDASTVAVLLPCTVHSNGAAVAESIRGKMRSHDIDLTYTIYVFPHDDDGHPELPSGLGAGASKDGAREPAVACGPEKTGAPAGCIAPAALPPMDANPAVLPLDDISVHPLPLWKRVTDIVISLIGIVLSGALMLAIALAIKIVSPGPVLFRQERVGFRGRRFTLLKFRSMKVAAATGVHQKHLEDLMKSDAKLTKLDKQDSRVIPMGRILRASGLDELPQLFNILRGDMSFIGPRPCVPYEYEQFHPWHRRRCHAYPGLTGLWQVTGKNKTTFVEMMRLDNAYARRRSFWLDMEILVKTVPVIWGQIKESAVAKGDKK